MAPRGEKGSHREKGSEKGGFSEQWSGGGEWIEKGAKGASRGGKGGKSKGRNGGKGSDAGRSQREKQGRGNPEGLQPQLRPQDLVLPPPPPQRPGDSSRGAEAPLPAAGQPTAEGDTAAQTRAKDEVFAEIRRVLEGTTPLQQADFDFRVRQHLHALYNQGGKERLREGLAVLQTATASKDRQAIKKWPAYLVTLLKRFDSDQASQDREARARARVAAAAAGAEPALEPKALPLVVSEVPSEGPEAANDDPFNFDSPLGGAGGLEPWAAWRMPSSPVAAR